MTESLKGHVRELLLKKNYTALADLCEKDRQYWQAVRFRLYDIDEALRWPAIEIVALFMQRRWNKGREEKVRIYIRTLFWSMTDESGGIGWSAPQTIAEIIAKIPVLVDPYGSMLIAHAIDEPTLLKGCLWGIGRLGQLMAGPVDSFRDKVLKVFRNEDAETLGLISWAMGETGFRHAVPFLEKLLVRTEPVRIYIGGDFYEKPLYRWVEEAIRKINATS